LANTCRAPECICTTYDTDASVEWRRRSCRLREPPRHQLPHQRLAGCGNERKDSLVFNAVESPAPLHQAIELARGGTTLDRTTLSQFGGSCARNARAQSTARALLSRRPARGCAPSDSRPTWVCRASNSTAAPPRRPAPAPHRPGLVAALRRYPRSRRPQIRRSVRRRRPRFRHARGVLLRAPRC
jgi:hypothetical protein